MKKKIMVLTSIWRTEFVFDVAEGAKERLKDEDVDLYMFNAYDIRAFKNNELQERRIFWLPDVKEFDAVLIALNSIGHENTSSRFVRECKKYNKPVITIDLRTEGAPFGSIDNYQSIYRVVEHMIDEHGCKTFNYLGGPEDNEENVVRFKAFCDCMEAHGIEVDPERVMHMSFLLKDGKKAYRTWKEKNLHLPDAVICANDMMAIGYTLESQMDGLYAPDDYRITGFDGMEDGRNNLPSITSVRRNWHEISYKCVDMLMNAIEKNTPVEDFKLVGDCVFAQSCGCVSVMENLRNAYIKLNNYVEERKLEDEKERDTRQGFCECAELDELLKKIAYVRKEQNINEFAIGVNLFERGEDTAKDFSQHMQIISETSRELIEGKKQLVPSHWIEEGKCNIYFFGSLYCGNTPLGYGVMKFQSDFLENKQHKGFLECVGLALNSIYKRRELRRTNEKLETLYIQDPLTGLYNRFGYKQEGGSFFREHNRRVYLAFFDVDGLKKINDTYGHAMGDIAICGVADVMKKVFHDGQVLIRMGGDEFLAIGACEERIIAEEKQQEISEYLEEYTMQKGLPFALRASVGFVWNTDGEDDLETLVQKADRRMYQIKQQKKLGR